MTEIVKMTEKVKVTEKVKLTEINNIYRPEFHYAPAENWLNDPNGLVYFEGEYHLFYQYYPHEMTWGPMHWGHAVSRDLIKWEHLPVALKPDEDGMIFSGSVVIDRNNSTGFFGKAPGLVAIYTNTPQDSENNTKLQSQSLAYSLDKGRTWTKYVGNPVIDNPGIKDFRDPKVLWYEPEEKWVVILACGDRVRFYASKDLKSWEFLSEFGEDEGCHVHVWECPDLFELLVDNESNSKWVLKVDVFDGAVAGGSGGQYFIGFFDGTKFVNDEKYKYDWVDYGMDFYASQSWFVDSEAEKRKLWLAWMSNWKYCLKTPTDKFRGAMTLPREVELKRTEYGIRLFQRPVRELNNYREEKIVISDHMIDPASSLTIEINKNTYELSTEFEDIEDDVIIDMQKKDSTNVLVRYNKKSNKLLMSRGNSGNSDFHEDFLKDFEANLLPCDTLKVQIIVDKCSVEIFANDGEAVITNLIFPFEEGSLIKISVPKGNAKIKTLNLYELNV